LRAGKLVLMPETDGEGIFEGSMDGTCMGLLRRLELRSCICAPLRTQGRRLGNLHPRLLSGRPNLPGGGSLPGGEPRIPLRPSG
jgi:hypothetical protein